MRATTESPASLILAYSISINSPRYYNNKPFSHRKKYVHNFRLFSVYKLAFLESIHMIDGEAGAERGSNGSLECSTCSRLPSPTSKTRKYANYCERKCIFTSTNTWVKREKSVRFMSKRIFSLPIACKAKGLHPRSSHQAWIRKKK